MFTRSSRHQLAQAMFWNAAGANLVSRLVRTQRLLDTVVRNYSLMAETNGERWLVTLLDEELIAFDVGFHDGASTAALLQARPRAHITAFDPSRFARNSYDQAFALDPRVVFVDQGLSDTQGEREFHDYGNMCSSFVARGGDLPGTCAATYKVAITTLDAYCRAHNIDAINYLKIDAEGLDLNVLEGAHGLLSDQAVDIVVFEFASGWAAAKRYLWEANAYFGRLPYRLHRLFNGFLCPLIYDVRIDSCCTLPAMYVGVSERRLARGGIPIRTYRL